MNDKPAKDDDSSQEGSQDLVPVEPREPERRTPDVPALPQRVTPGYMPESLPRDDGGPLESPFPTGTISFMQDVREAVLALKLSGSNVHKRSIRSGVLGAVLEKVDALADALAGMFEVQAMGSGASVYLEFVHPPHEGEQLSPLGPGAPRSVEVGQQIHDLIAVVVAANTDQPLTSKSDEVMTRAQALPIKASDAYLELLKIIGRYELDAAWLAREREPVELSWRAARQARSTLEMTSETERKQDAFEGTLYQINSTNTRFRLRPPAKSRRVIIGSFSESVRDELRSAWGRKVVATLAFDERTVLRTGEPERDRYELLSIDEVLDD